MYKNVINTTKLHLFWIHKTLYYIIYNLQDFFNANFNFLEFIWFIWGTLSDFKSKVRLNENLKKRRKKIKLRAQGQNSLEYYLKGV